MPNIRESEGATACQVIAAEVSFHPQKFVTPLVLSTGTIEQITEAQVAVTMRVRGCDQLAVGRGSIYLSDLWSWPESPLPHAQRDQVLRRVCNTIASEFPQQLADETSHPLETGLRLHQWVCHDLPVTPDLPVLARAMCASPFDAAIHDAVGIALNQSAFQFYNEPVELPSADPFFPKGGAAQAIANVIRKPRSTLSAWFIVNKNTDLKETFPPAIQRHGFRCFKLKITGRDNETDAARTVEVYRAAKSLGIENPSLVVDSNEANPDAESVLDYLQRLETSDPDAYEALAYIEQPTGRDITQHSFDWHQVTTRKPVLLDEGLTDLSILETALAQGWSGIALKTCKGQSMLLATAAWAHQHQMLISLQDLTNPGISLIHAALAGAHLPTINGVELNSPQFSPSANADFLPRLSDLFEPSGGVHKLPATQSVGLGSTL